MAKKREEKKKKDLVNRTIFLDGLSGGQKNNSSSISYSKENTVESAGENTSADKSVKNSVEKENNSSFLFSAGDEGFFDVEVERNKKGTRFSEVFTNFINRVSFTKIATVCFLLFFSLGGWSLYSQASDLGGEVKGAAYQGKQHLTQAREAVDNYDLLLASEEFKLASDQIGKASEELIRKGQYMPYWDQLSYQNEQSSMVASVILIDRTISNLNMLYSSFLGLTERGDFSQQSQIRVSRNLDQLSRNLSILGEKIDSLGSSQYFFPSEIEAYNKDIELLENQIILIKRFVDQSPKLLGYNGEKKYLLLFQNNAEPRPTGGFIGTFGYLTVDNGRIADLKVDEIYGPRDRLRATKLDGIKASELGYPEGFPEELIPNDQIKQEYLHSFYVQNTNVTPDFGESARRALWSFENVLEQPEAEEVIAINPNVIESILEIVGPIEVGEHGVELDSSNFRDVVQYKVEIDNPFKKEDQEDYNPKQILVDFTPKFLEKITSLDIEDKAEVFASILDQAKNKHILAYSQDQALEQLITSYGMDGRVDQSNSDYLQINLDALNATKSGLFLEKDYQLNSALDKEGNIRHNLEITLENLADGSRKYYSEIDLLVRVMVPYGSDLERVLIESKDQIGDIDKIAESGKTVYLIPVSLDRGERKIINLSYQSQYLLEGGERYSFIYQTQPGSIKTDFSWRFSSPERSRITNYYPKIINFIDQSTLGYSQKAINKDFRVDLGLLP